MDEKIGEQAATGALTWERVAASAIQQAARHERALEACLAELDGGDAPHDDLAEATHRRAMRHAQRAVGLAKTAARVNRDPLAEAFFAALLERHERNALLVERMPAVAQTPALSIAV
jgi:hypothetical protein